jgi:hypothetical protein
MFCPIVSISSSGDLFLVFHVDVLVPSKRKMQIQILRCMQHATSDAWFLDWPNGSEAKRNPDSLYPHHLIGLT